MSNVFVCGVCACVCVCLCVRFRFWEEDGATLINNPCAYSVVMDLASQIDGFMG